MAVTKGMQTALLITNQGSGDLSSCTLYRQTAASSGVTHAAAALCRDTILLELLGSIWHFSL